MLAPPSAHSRRSVPTRLTSSKTTSPQSGALRLTLPCHSFTRFWANAPFQALHRRSGTQKCRYGSRRRRPAQNIPFANLCRLRKRFCVCDRSSASVSTDPGIEGVFERKRATASQESSGREPVLRAPVRNRSGLPNLQGGRRTAAGICNAGW